MNIFNQLVALNQDPVEQRALSLFKFASLYKINPKTIVEVGVWNGACGAPTNVFNQCGSPNGTFAFFPLNTSSIPA